MTLRAPWPAGAPDCGRIIHQRRVFRVFLDDLRSRSRAQREEREATHRGIRGCPAPGGRHGPDPSVLELHRAGPEMSGWWPVCLGCDGSGSDAEPPAWPCRTWTLIEQALTR